MKRILPLALTCIMLLALAATAFADVMWEPMENQFYDRQRDECEYNARSYYANGKEGFVTLWDAPGGSLVKAQYQNGELLWVGYTYKNWALASMWLPDDRTEVTGWVPMADLYLQYDHISFEEEYGDQFVDYNGEFAGYTPQDEGETFWFWEYPHAGSPRERIQTNEDMLDALRGTAEQQSHISKVYVDQSGQSWGYVTYLYGIRNFWLLLDNPTGGGITTSCVPEVDGLIYSGEIIPPQEPVMPGKSYLPAILTAAVVVVTAGALAFFYGKRKKPTE